jgi:hypothetical protein
MIIGFLSTDRDVVHYGLMSKDAYASINESVWFRRFLDKFDVVDGNAKKVAALYFERARITNAFTAFNTQKYLKTHPSERREQEDRQLICLSFIKSLILGKLTLAVVKSPSDT